MGRGVDSHKGERKSKESRIIFAGIWLVLMWEYCFTSSELNYTIVLCAWADSHTCHKSADPSYLLLWQQQHRTLCQRALKFCCDSVSYCKIKKINWENICLLSFSMAHIHSTNKIWQIPQCSRKLSLLNPAFSVSELLPYPINLSLNQRPYNKQDRKQRQCIDCKDFKFISMSVLNYRILWC